MFKPDDYPELQQSLERRRFLKAAAAGTLVAALGGGTYVLAAEDDPRAKQLRARRPCPPPPGPAHPRRAQAHGRRPGRPQPRQLPPPRPRRGRQPPRPRLRRAHRPASPPSRPATSTASPAGACSTASGPASSSPTSRSSRRRATRPATSSSRRPTATPPTSAWPRPWPPPRSSSTATRAPPSRAPRPAGALADAGPLLLEERQVAHRPLLQHPVTAPASGRRAATTTTPTPGKRSAMGDARSLRARARFPWRAWLRAFHRDVGNLAVGLTLVYALSGLAVNHIADWEPSFTSYQQPRELGGPVAGTDDEAAAAVMARLGRARARARRLPRGARRPPDRLRQAHAAREHGHRPRPRRGREAALLPPRGQLAAPQPRQERVDATSPTPMRRGWSSSPSRASSSTRAARASSGGAARWCCSGAAIPIAYVVLSGGPEHARGDGGRPRPPPGAERAP